VKNNKNNRCIITGVDVFELPFKFNEDSALCQTIKANLLNAIVELYNQGVDEFYTDCSYGFPLWGGEIVTGLMKYNDIMLYVVYPFENQPYSFATNWQDRFHKVHELCTDVIPTYLEYDEIEDTRTFLDLSEEELTKKAYDFMLGDCGRLLFYGNGQGNYIYEQAVKLNYDIKILKCKGDSE
jgi:uncharacterized phage-like protein YoqJ